MTVDLFDKRSDKDKLYEFIKSRNWVKSSDVLKWSVQNYSNRGDRNARQLCEDGLIRRMSEEEKIRIFGPKIKEDVWILV